METEGARHGASARVWLVMHSSLAIWGHLLFMEKLVPPISLFPHTPFYSFLFLNKEHHSFSRTLLIPTLSHFFSFLPTRSHTLISTISFFHHYNPFHAILFDSFLFWPFSFYAYRWVWNEKKCNKVKTSGLLGIRVGKNWMEWERVEWRGKEWEEIELSGRKMKL